jgi:TolB-like protein/Tfp pilus assembly protein PilF
MGAILYEPAPFLSASAPHLPADLSNIVQRMLMKDAASRYPSAGDVRADLMRLRNFPGAAAKEASTPPAIAILPFIDLSPNRDQEYFCDGLAEELITALSKLQGLRVASRTSSFRFRGTDVDMREVQERLKVTTVLEGSVRKAGDKIRIAVKLVDVNTGYPLWSERFDRHFDDIFEIQDEIAQSVVEKFRLSIASTSVQELIGNSVANTRAYEFYLKGRYYWNKRTEEDLKRSVEFFERALNEEEHYALALAGLAECCVTLALYGALPPTEVMPKAKESAEKALLRKADLPEALNALACSHAVYDWDWDRAETAFKRAINANPQYAGAHQWYAVNCLVPLGRFSEARAAVKRASALEPLSLAVLATSGLVSFYQREYEHAIEEYRRSLELDENFAIAYYFLGQVYVEKEMWQEAIAQLERAVVLSNRSPECVAGLAHAYANRGDRKKAVELKTELERRSHERYVSPVVVAWVCMGLGDRDGVFANLERAYRCRATDLIWLRARPVFDPVRSDPRFENLCKRLGL